MKYFVFAISPIAATISKLGQKTIGFTSKHSHRSIKLYSDYVTHFLDRGGSLALLRALAAGCCNPFYGFCCGPWFYLRDTSSCEDNATHANRGWSTFQMRTKMKNIQKYATHRCSPFLDSL